MRQLTDGEREIMGELERDARPAGDAAVWAHLVNSEPAIRDLLADLSESLAPGGAAGRPQLVWSGALDCYVSIPEDGERGQRAALRWIAEHCGAPAKAAVNGYAHAWLRYRAGAALMPDYTHHGVSTDTARHIREEIDRRVWGLADDDDMPA